MYPNSFESLEEIGKKFKLLSNSRLFSLDDNRILAQLFYDTYKIAAYSLKRKTSMAKRPTRLKRSEVARLIKLISYHHHNNKIFLSKQQLTQCFGNFTQDDAIRFFELYVEGDVVDKFGKTIRIDMEDGLKFMYKNEETGKHDVDPIYYKPDRGKRLPWIRHTIINSTNIYQKTFRNKLDRMYVGEYDIPLKDDKSVRCFWILIAKKNLRDKTGPFNFTTAYPVFSYNHFLKILETFDPVK